MLIEKPVRHRSKRHRVYVASLACLACHRGGASQAHHLTFVQPKARGLKAGDQWTVPLCDDCHRRLHAYGNERLWWGMNGVDPVLAAQALWSETSASSA